MALAWSECERSQPVMGGDLRRHSTRCVARGCVVRSRRLDIPDSHPKSALLVPGACRQAKERDALNKPEVGPFGASGLSSGS